MSQQKPTVDGEDDLAILHPERSATIAGVAVVMREYGFVEGMRLNALVVPIVAGMAVMLDTGDLTDLNQLGQVFADNADGVAALIAAACDQPQAWVESLDDDSGRALHLLWWSVNAPFFGRRLVDSVVVRQLQECAGLTSMPPSLVPATSHSARGHAVN